jgi:two-component sensor histidine kinase
MDAEPQKPRPAEAHHRFLNTLTTLHSLLRHDFAAFRDPQVRDAVEGFEFQLLAFAGVQRSLETSIVDVIDVPVHFGRLCAEISSMQLAPRGLHCDFSAGEGERAPEIGRTLGLIIVELITNAAKHAFQGRDRRGVSVAMRRTDRRWVCMVRDDGAGLQSGAAGAGLRLIQAFADYLDADLGVCSDDTGVQVRLHLPDRPAHAARPG